VRRQRNRSGSISFDNRVKTWHFVFWENGKRRSKKIGREPIPDEGVSVASRKTVTRCSRRKPNASHPQLTDRQRAGRAIPNRKNADTLQHPQIV
jgi:hypothetical protein